MAWSKTYSGPEPIRVNKWLAEEGVCSRREAETLIADGFVDVDGIRLSHPGHKINPGETLNLSERAEARLDQQITVILNKPEGIVSGTPEGDEIPAVRLLTPEALHGLAPFQPGRGNRLAPLGRLDKESRGMLILSEDGVLAKAVIGPLSTLDKEYVVKVAGEITPEAIALLCHGLELDERELKPAIVTQEDAHTLRFILNEGRNRQIRRMCELVGLRVADLVRVRIGPLRLGDLKEGEWRPMSDAERAAILATEAPARDKPARAPRSDHKRDYDAPRRAYDPNEDARPPRADRGGEGMRHPYAGNRPRTDDRGPRRDFGDRPPRDFKPRGDGERTYRPRSEGSGPRRDFSDRGPRRDFGDRPPRRDFGDRPPRDFKPRGDGAGPRRDFGDRPPRRDFGDRPPRDFKPRGDGGAPRRDYSDRPRTEGRPPRRDFGDRPPRRDFGDRPPRDFKPRSEGDRPFKPRVEGAGPRRDFGDRGPRRDFGDRPPRDFKPREGDAPRSGRVSDRPARSYAPRDGEARPRRDFSDRPPRKDFGDRPPRRDFGDRPPRKDFGDRPPRDFKPRGDGDRPFKPRGDGAGPRRDSGDRPPRRDFGDRPPRRDFGDRPPRKDFGDRPPRDFKPRTDGDRPFKPRGDRPPRDFKPRGEGAGPRRDFGDGPPRKDFGDRPPRAYKPRDGEAPRSKSLKVRPGDVVDAPRDRQPSPRGKRGAGPPALKGANFRRTKLKRPPQRPV